MGEWSHDIPKKDTPSIYFDIDGVLGRWYPDGRGLKYPEQILDPQYHYFLNIETQPLAISLAKDLHEKGYDVCVLSASDIRTIDDKSQWCDKHMSFIPKENIFFCPLGADKSQYVKGNAEISVLVDDFPKNLKEWKGVAVKGLNGLNSRDEVYDSVYIGDLPKENMELQAHINSEIMQKIMEKLMHRDILCRECQTEEMEMEFDR